MKIAMTLSLFLIMPLSIFSDSDLYVKLAQKIRSQHIKEMGRKGFELVLVGGGMFNDVEMISSWFQLDAAPTLEEARIMYLNGAERLLASVNQDKAIRAYLHDYPFTIGNLDYSLMFRKLSANHNNGVESIYSVSCIKGKIYYDVFAPTSLNPNGVKTVCVEPYEEALRIARDSRALTMSINK